MPPDELTLTMAYLKTHFPIRRKVVIRRIKTSVIWGNAVCGDNQITININKDSEIKVEILIHEWAHIRCDGVEHSECWGKEYARIYSKIIGVK
jgi:hypothetical protein